MNTWIQNEKAAKVSTIFSVFDGPAMRITLAVSRRSSFAGRGGTNRGFRAFAGIVVPLDRMAVVTLASLIGTTSWLPAKVWSSSL